MKTLLTVALQTEHSVVAARQRARQVAEGLGFESQDQTRIATAVSEIARNAFRYAGGGKVEYLVSDEQPLALLIRITDQGPGIADVDAVLGGTYVSRTGMGMGLIGARRLMDIFELDTQQGSGTAVTIGKYLPVAARGLSDGLGRVTDSLMAATPVDVSSEAEVQDRELLRTLSELRNRQDDLLRLNQELEDTNRGVVALYAELEERADQLRRANTMKAQFLSYMSHEFRTPLDSMIALSGLLLSRVDGELTSEQERQVAYLQRSARDLLHLVDDLLDTARVDAGQVAVRLGAFTVGGLFNTLRALLRPLTTADAAELVFEEARELPSLYTDEGKVAQILRNLISNALKFTEEGEVRVSASAEANGDWIHFVVADTGIGIGPEDQARIFEDFAQIDGAVQRRVKGTGLGLPLSRKLAEILGGRVELESESGVGSRFHLILPREYQDEDRIRDAR